MIVIYWYKACEASYEVSTGWTHMIWAVSNSYLTKTNWCTEMKHHWKENFKKFFCSMWEKWHNASDGH
jgi:hypothetical protein